MSSLNIFHNILNKYSVARQNQYMVFIDPPAGLNEVYTGLLGGKLSEALTVYCQSVSMPPKNVMTSPVRLEHATREIPFGVSYDPVVLTFYVDQNFAIRDFFTAWHDLVYSDETHGLGFYNDYVGTLTIVSEDKSETGTTSDSLETSNEYKGNYAVILEKAYPKTLGSVQFSATDQGEVATIQIEMVYEYMTEGDQPTRVHL